MPVVSIIGRHRATPDVLALVDQARRHAVKAFECFGLEGSAVQAWPKLRQV